MDRQLGAANTLPADGNPYASNALLAPDGSGNVAIYRPDHANGDSTRTWVVTSGSGAIRVTSAYVTGWHPLAPMSLSDTIRVQDGRRAVKLPDVSRAEAEAAVEYFRSHSLPGPHTLDHFVTVKHAVEARHQGFGYVGITGRELPGEHWNARTIREQQAANRLVAAMRQQQEQEG